MIPAILLVVFGAAQQPTVECRDGEIWLARDGSAPVLLANDRCYKSRPLWSPDGSKFAYFTNTTEDRPSCPTEVVLYSSDGTRLRSIPALDKGNAVNRIEWLGDSRIGIDTHINPSLGQYRIVDAMTGSEVSSCTGFGFVPSPDFTRVAHAGWIPHFAPPFARNEYLMVDDRIVYPSGAGDNPNLAREDPQDQLLYRDIHEFVAPFFVWSPDGTRIAFVERLFDWRADGIGSYRGEEENSRWQLVMVPATGGTALCRALPQAVRGEPTTLRWTGPDRIAITGGGLDGEYPAR